KTPDNEGCWSQQANALYNELYRVFGRQRLPRHSTYKSATSSEEALMDEIERAVVLPNGANPLDAYGRNYAFTGAGTVVAVYLLPSGANRRPSATQMPAGERRWYRDASDLPGLSDRGCMQVTVDYDIATHRVLGVACN
ncbi:MAG TPA: hypothetical protein VF079_05940, partial [Sphingomicrobium sp.]